MKKLLATSIVLVIVASTALAHAGHAHTYMGTVTMIHSDTQFMIKTTDGRDVTIDTTAKTSWRHADGHRANRNELAVGSRVVVKMNKNGKTAASIKIGSAAK